MRHSASQCVQSDKRVPLGWALHAAPLRRCGHQEDLEAKVKRISEKQAKQCKGNNARNSPGGIPQEEWFPRFSISSSVVSRFGSLGQLVFASARDGRQLLAPSLYSSQKVATGAAASQEVMLVFQTLQLQRSSKLPKPYCGANIGREYVMYTTLDNVHSHD